MTDQQRVNGADEPSQAQAPARGWEPPTILHQTQGQSEKLLLWVARLLFLVLLVTVTVLTIASAKGEVPEEFDRSTVFGLFLASMAVGVIVLLVDALTPNKRLTSVVGVYLGICVGLIGALAIGALIDVVAEAWDITSTQPGQPPTRMEIYLGLGKVIVAIVLCYLAVSVVLTTKDDFRLVIPYVEFAKQVRGVRPMLLDSSALIDGRIESLAGTGFLSAPLVVPQFVLDELQTLADSSDKLKRAKGRRGLSLVSKLQGSAYLDVTIDDTDVPGRSVDHKLLQLGAAQNMSILSTDYNLNKVAEIHGVSVMNINELARALKPEVTPGEVLTVEIMKRGESAEQGVGYMPDGTMVVVEEAADLVGQDATLVVTNSLQTSAGRMIFGRLAGDEDGKSLDEQTQVPRAAFDRPQARARRSPGH